MIERENEVGERKDYCLDFLEVEKKYKEKSSEQNAEEFLLSLEVLTAFVGTRRAAAELSCRGEIYVSDEANELGWLVEDLKGLRKLFIEHRAVCFYKPLEVAYDKQYTPKLNSLTRKIDVLLAMREKKGAEQQASIIEKSDDYAKHLKGFAEEVILRLRRMSNDMKAGSVSIVCEKLNAAIDNVSAMCEELSFLLLERHLSYPREELEQLSRAFASLFILNRSQADKVLSKVSNPIGFQSILPSTRSDGFGATSLVKEGVVDESLGHSSYPRASLSEVKGVPFFASPDKEKQGRRVKWLDDADDGQLVTEYLLAEEEPPGPSLN